MEDSKKNKEKRLQEQKNILENVEQKTNTVLKTLLKKSINNIKSKN